MKPEITKEQAEAITYLRGHGRDDEYILSHFGVYVSHCAVLNELSRVSLAAALINGYEIVMTPEEKVKAYYEKLAAKRRYVPGCIDEIKIYTEMDAIRRTLDMLGIEIDFVNVRREEAEANGFGY
ncbi:hypothetical protein CTV96_09435 [Bacillus altitudinis]|uniref:hypothetical protein n=1 Tax=Bacillus altitudinis TaxID=293387 RepID=UPI000C234D0F|nr:hypothetical protein [Bacillus altitudinis]PJI12360.1 hypothetical protein CTV96_09435 [Bacillus altitudinis]PKQ85626.1 hypothetical protein CTV98_007660 [Bacillus altitudinis]